jgi:plasmid stability protein
MAAVTVRNLDDQVKERLRVRAAVHGRSMESEIRAMLADAVSGPGDTDGFDTEVPGVVERWHQLRKRAAPDQG